MRREDQVPRWVFRALFALSDVFTWARSWGTALTPIVVSVEAMLAERRWSSYYLRRRHFKPGCPVRSANIPDEPHEGSSIVTRTLPPSLAVLSLI